MIRHRFSPESREHKALAEMIENEKIAIAPLAYIRGRTLDHVFFIVDEAQNLTPHEVKTIITRAGEGTKMVFTGDIHQIDTPYLDSQSNGLTYLVDRMKEQDLFAHVNLMKGDAATSPSSRARCSSGAGPRSQAAPGSASQSCLPTSSRSRSMTSMPVARVSGPMSRPAMTWGGWAEASKLKSPWRQRANRSREAAIRLRIASSRGYPRKNSSSLSSGAPPSSTDARTGPFGRRSLRPPPSPRERGSRSSGRRR